MSDTQAHLAEAREKLAAVAAELQRSFAMSAVNSDPHGAWRDAVVYVKQAIRAVLADHADTLANVKADAWDEGWRVGASGRNMPNPYRTSPTP